MSGRIIGILSFVILGSWFQVFAQHPDRVIVDNLKAEFDKLNLGNVEVSSYMGEVVLSGEVHSEDQKITAERVALATAGVKKVRSNLSVNPFLRARLAVPCIAPKLEGNVQGQTKLNMSCLNNVIHVEGEVEYEWDEQKVLELIKEANPNFDIKSKVVVTKPSSDEQIREAIMTALNENKHPLEGIAFDVKNRIVTFRGKVSNHRIIDAILATALMVDGVREVRSEVLVEKK
ncbi:MAG: BON domain-containing protein [Deltaproteobacteria bacterium]|nr:BON domain-containing protein [Deltaproteobacteria bacterium]MCX7953219.1 BON domain-containing protein [Deltaproteobacteria bacterium]